MKHLLVLLVTYILSATIGSALAAETDVRIRALKVEPLKFNVTNGLKVEPVLKGDVADSKFGYRWFINGDEVLFETSESLAGDLLHRDDDVSVEVTLIDVEGNILDIYEALPLKVMNASPLIYSEPPSEFGDREFHYQVEASDPDGDNLSYKLENAPNGMQIDSLNGSIYWGFEKVPEGQYAVLIVVEDGFEGRAEQSLELNLTLVAK